MRADSKNKEVLKRIARRRERARISHKKWLRRYRRSLQLNDKTQAIDDSPPKDLEPLVAPENFSMNENTDTVVAFIAELETYFKEENKVFVDLRNVTNIDYGAIVALLSIMAHFKENKIRFNGNFPNDPEIKRILTDSGFFSQLYQNIDRAKPYVISNSSDNSVSTLAWKKVDTALSSRIIEESSVTIWGTAKRCQGVQRCIGELMLNTNNHAEIGEKGVKNWWLYVNHNPEKRIVSFAFVDFGVGIFESLKNKPDSSKWSGWLPKIKELMLHGNDDILRLIMSGDFHRTVTGKYYRGKGLPGIAEALKRNQLSDLIIMSNDAFGNISKGDYKILNSKFNGTYVYWELREDNEHC